MKKLLSVVLTVALVLSIGATDTFAASKGHGANYMDLNNDGICDNYTDGCTRPLDGTGRKIRRRCKSSAVGTNFVDSDGDGICDNYAADYGTGNQYKRGQR